MSSGHDSAGGWGPGLLYLLERHPRSSWSTQESPSAAFWLEVHEHLRRDCAGLEAAADERRSGRTSAAQLAAVAAPRLRGLVAAMIGHHQIEDYHYFPAFRRDEPRLAAGFDRLESDHAALAHDVGAAQRALADLAAAAETPALEVAAARYVAAAQRLCARLRSHLADEEDLVVPLLIERRER